MSQLYRLNDGENHSIDGLSTDTPKVQNVVHSLPLQERWKQFQIDNHRRFEN